MIARFGLLAGALALLIQIFAWTLALPAMNADGVWITICTANGLTEIQVDANGDPAGDETPAPPSGSCPLCPVIGGLSVPPPLFLAAVPPMAIHNGATALPGDRISAGWFLSSLQARAPPSLG